MSSITTTRSQATYQTRSNRQNSTAGRVCVLGAGSSGLAVAKNLKQAGIAIDVLEKQGELGGNWCYGQPASSVYKSTHLISSKQLTEYTDFPMPDNYPEFPHHRLVWKYLRSYAEHFDLEEHIEFGVGVQRATRLDEGGWWVELDSGETRHYARLVVANGHNWDPRWPEFSGEFAGVQLHSSEYKTPDVLAGKRVLVVGGGNSGCDIAVEAAQNAASASISLRRGYHLLPKFFHGTPIDICGERMLRWRFPLPLRRTLAAAASFLVLGSPRWLGLPKPDHRLFETHPVINSQLIYHVGHGDIQVRPNIAELCGERVRFADGTEEPFDVIIYATGFKVTLPFLPSGELRWSDGRPELFLNVFPPDCDDLFFAGLIQPDSGQFGLVDEQAKLIAAYLTGIEAGKPAADWFRQEKRRRAGEPLTSIRYLATPRHALEVEHFSYRRRLQKLTRRLNRG
ncbi:MAG: NAD(P)-binding domain-containing protein [Planctomycetota bacterium]